MNISTPIRHDPSIRTFSQWNEAELRRRSKRLRALYTIQDPQIRRKAQEADYQLCRDNPQYWIEQYGWLANPQEGSIREFPFVMFDEQVSLLNTLVDSIKEGFPVLVNKGRGLGITWEMLFMIAHQWRFSPMFSAKLGSRKQDLVDDSTLDSLFGKIRFILNKQPPHLRETNKKDIFLQIVNNRISSEIIGEATNAGFGRGGRKTVVMLDEFAHNLPAISDAIWKSVDTVAKAIWLPSSPRGKGNKFYFLYSSLQKRSVVEITWRANPYRDDKWKAERLKVLNEDEFNQEHDASFSAVRIGKIFKTQKDMIQYSESDEEWIQKRERAKSLFPHVGGWDFGSGPSSTVCLYALIEYLHRDPVPIIWIDDENAWNSTGHRTISTDALIKIKNYTSDFKIHYGDPAGKNAESDQNSWIRNLQNDGIPIMQVDQGEFNTQVGIDTNIKLVQHFIDSGKLRIHVRCRGLWESVEQWRFNIPDGIPIELVDKSWIAPKKDGYSHYTNALMYLVGAVYRYMQQDMGQDYSELNNVTKKYGKANLSEMLGIARQV